MGRKGYEQRYTQGCWGNLRGRGHLEDLRVDGIVILTWLNKQDWMACIRFLWLTRGPSGGLCSVP